MIDTSTVPDIIPRLRKSITSHQRRLLDAIWSSYRDTGNFPLKRQLELQDPELGRQAVLEELDRLGGHVVFTGSRSADNVPDYQVTLLGALLTSDGEHVEDVLARFLATVRAATRRDPSKSRISARDIAKGGEFEAEEVALIGKALCLLSRWLYWGGGPSLDWDVGIPNYIDDILDAKDLRIEVRKIAAIDYDPECPIDPNKRQQFVARRNRERESKQEPEEFWFVQDEGLRVQLTADWKEAQAAVGVQAWKACMVLCGAIAEGLLLDALGVVAEIHPTTKTNGKGSSELSLSDLINLAEKRGLLSGPLKALGHAQREFRNLIHPMLQLKHGIPVSNEGAQVSLNFVRMLVQRLAEVAKKAEEPRSGVEGSGPDSE